MKPSCPREAKLVNLQVLEQKHEREREALVKQLAEIEDRIFKIKLEYAETYNQGSPFAILPTEIACTIFKMACGPSPFVHDDSNDMPGEGEITISHVCRLWRSISLAYPDLWSTFASYLDSSRHDSDRLIAYLERSGNHPLEIWIQCHGPSDVLIHMVDKLLENVFRWSRISFHFPYASFDIDERLCQALEHATAPNLQSCEIIIPQGKIVDHTFRPSFTGGAPKLTHVRMDSRSFSAYRPPTSAITTLQIEEQFNWKHTSYPWTTFLDLIRSPALTTLSIAGDLFRPPRDNAYQRRGGTMISSNLKYFRCSSEEVAVNMWLYLEAHQLETLAFVMTILDDWQFPLDETIAYRSGGTSNTVQFPSLRALVLIECPICPASPSCSLLLAHATRAVTHLIISQSEGECVFDSIFAQRPETVLWPHLEILTCDVDLGDLNIRQEIFEALKYRSTVLKKHCILRLSSETAQSHQSSRNSLRNSGFFEEIAEHIFDIVPGPPNDDVIFDSSSSNILFWPV